VSASLNPANTLVGQSLIPAGASIANFERLVNDPVHPWPLWLANSVKVSLLTAIGVVGITAFGAYSFSRFRYRGRRVTLLTILLVQLFPNILALVALFLLAQQIGNVVPWLGLDTHGGLILIYLGGALGFNTWLMKGYFDTVPRELDESARIDGATGLQTFRYVIFPLVRPVLAVVGMLTFIGTYSDFIFPRIMLKSTESYTFALGMTFFIRGQYTREWGAFAAAALLGAIPIVVMFFLLQRYLVSGLTRGAVKG
jgi:arabinogalactan oligomer/maltooligosaccharide transport system permease protein